MKNIIGIFKNKYFLSLLIFGVWMMFFDSNDMISQYGYSNKVKKLKEEKEFYLKETAQVKQDLKELDSNLQSAEKFAREKYFMKKDNEDVFVIVNQGPKEEK
ncbi:MAG: septum formation initiator family protein [Pedobacter sp.]|nr:MAG: septum formation initiator family protein [Pedobacter sp.]